MTSTPTPALRMRAFWLTLAGLIYAWCATLIAIHAAHGLAAGDWEELTTQAMLLFLLLVGYFVLSRLSGLSHPLAAMGLAQRPGRRHEFALGAAAGWGLLLLSILPSVFIGGLVVRFWTAGHQWFLLALDAAVLLLMALSQEMIFRGYPFQRLMEAIGPGMATVLMSAIFTAAHFNPEAPRAAMLVSFLLSVILCIAYQRTRALWLPWGFHFAWNASMGLLFGLPISGYTRFTPIVQSYALGPPAWTGGDFGPEGSVFALLVAMLGMFVMYRITREYAHIYAQPVIIPGGIPVDLDAVARRQHEEAMGIPAAPAEPKLVQIGGPLPGPAVTVGPPAPVLSTQYSQVPPIVDPRVLAADGAEPDPEPELTGNPETASREPHLPESEDPLRP